MFPGGYRDGVASHNLAAVSASSRATNAKRAELLVTAVSRRSPMAGA